MINKISRFLFPKLHEDIDYLMRHNLRKNKEHMDRGLDNKLNYISAALKEIGISPCDVCKTPCGGATKWQYIGKDKKAHNDCLTTSRP